MLVSILFKLCWCELCLIVCLIVCLFVCLTDWLIDWLTDWLIDWLTDWLIDWLTDWLTGWLVDWLIGWLIDWLIDWDRKAVKATLVLFPLLGMIYLLFITNPSTNLVSQRVFTYTNNVLQSTQVNYLHITSWSYTVYAELEWIKLESLDRTKHGANLTIVWSPCWPSFYAALNVYATKP